MLEVNFQVRRMLLIRYLSFVYNGLVKPYIYASWAVLGEGCSSACGRKAQALLVLGRLCTFWLWPASIVQAWSAARVLCSARK